MKNSEIIERLEWIEKLVTLINYYPLTLSEAAEYLGISKAGLYQLVHKNKIPHYKPAGGKKLYFSRLELNSWVFARRIPTDKEMDEIATEYVVFGKRNWRLEKFKGIYKSET